MQQVKPLIEFEKARGSINANTEKHGVVIGVPKFYQGDSGFTVVTLDVRVQPSARSEIAHSRTFYQVVGVAKYNPNDGKRRWVVDNYLGAYWSLGECEDPAYGQELALKRAIRSAFDLAKTKRESIEA